MAGSLQNWVQDQMADVTECSICKDIFTNPKSLPCLHSFCLECLEKYGKYNNPGNQMVCPICRSNFVIPKGGFNNMPNNFFINKMVEIRRLSITTTSETLCATCPQEERVNAKMICIECEQNLCERCGKSHKKIKLCQNHQVLEIGNKRQEVNFRDTCCDQHPGELVKMYCEDDKATICFLCFAESHQTHKCFSVAKASEEFSPKLKKDLEAVKRRLPECKDSLDKLMLLKIGLLRETAEAERKIVGEATRLKALVDSQADVLTQRLTAIKDKKLKEMESTHEDVERFKIMIESYSRYLEQLLDKGAPGDICREANQMKTRARELTALPGICCGCDCCWNKIVFKSSNLEDVLNIHCIANAVGEVQLRSSNNELLGHKIIPTEPCMTQKHAKHAAFGTARIYNRKRSIAVLNIPGNISIDILTMIFESHRHGGGEIDEIGDIEYTKGSGAAIITFKDASVADGLASKGHISFKGIHMYIRKT